MNSIAYILYLLSCLQIDIVIVGDRSGSIKENLTIVADAIQAFSDQLDLGTGDINLSIVMFSSTSEVVVPLTTNRKIINKGIQKIRKEGYKTSTFMYGALQTAARELMNNSIFGHKKMILVISDGNPSMHDETQILSLKIQQGLGAIVCGVLIITEETREEFMEELCTEGCFVSTDYNRLIDTLRSFEYCF